jgi:lipoate-protein ligase A
MQIKEPFRLINYASDNAAMNMAIDEAILQAHLDGHVPPTLRVYQFAPPAVSLGYAQKVNKEVVDKIKKKNLDVVRRPTGGRAVLHMGDITYAFICSSKGVPLSQYALVGESIVAAYKQICQALILALKHLGIEVELGQRNGRYQDKHDCFAATTNADLQYQGKKIAGSAQLRRHHAVLQHGSIILNQPQLVLSELLDAKEDFAINGFAHHANISEICDCEPSSLEKPLQIGFESVFRNKFLAAPLTEQEQELAKTLHSKYAVFNNN